MNTINEFKLFELKRSMRTTSGVQTEALDFLIEEIEECDEFEWPPEQVNRYVYWQPDKLEENSFELLKIHKLVILKNLERRMGCFAEINLWEWYWKHVVSNYFKELKTELEFNVTTSTEFDDLDDLDCIPSLEYVDLVKKLSPSCSGYSELDRRSIPYGQGSLNDTDYARLLHLQKYFLQIDQNCKKNKNKNSLVHTFHNLATKSKYSSRGYEGLTFYDPKEWEQLLCEDHKIHCVQNMLISRFALWWGWSDAPFTCISKLVSSHLDSMIREGYLLRETGKPDKYQLSEEGYARLKTSMDQRSKGKVLGWLRSADLASFSKDILLNYIEQLF